MADAARPTPVELGKVQFPALVILNVMRKRIIQVTVAVIVVAGLGAGGWILYRRSRHNSAASCANCRSFIDSAMEQHFMEAKDEWYPRGGKTPVDSLIVLMKWLSGPHHFTSHALSTRLGEHYEKHGILTYEFMCYRYNEGLRRDDPDDLIVMYYLEPTRWECSSHRMDFVGRPAMSVGGSWGFVRENEFQQRQTATLDYIRERTAREPELKTIRQSLLLSVQVQSQGKNAFRFTAEMTNQGDETINIEFRNNGSLDGSSLLDPLKERREISLLPGASFTFPGWRQVAITDTVRDGGIIGRHYSRSGMNSKGSGSHGYGSPRPPEEVNKAEAVQASIAVRVQTDEIKAIDLVIQSPRVLYMMKDA